ncbi:MAG: DnaB-like helicase C-terminal domain-containing protein [Bacteroidales bacterium]
MNEPMIRQWFDVFKNNNQLTEIRVIGSRKTLSGYFTDVDTIINAIREHEDANIYFTLNAINDSCYDREQKDKLVFKPKSTTSDNDIVGIDWIMVDIDVEKPSDTNSTDEEKELAKQVANNVYKYLRDCGFSAPVVCDSSNGVHLNYQVAMSNTKENAELRKKFLQALDMVFSTDKVKVDTSTFNASRICKTYGVMSRKGSSTSTERPQRESAIIRVPDEIKITANELIQKVASTVPEKEKPNKYNNYNAESFDLDEFIAKHNIKIRNQASFTGGTKYVLEACPFDPSHKAPDSAIFKLNDGSVGFKCLHNSDSDKGWKEFRSFYEPDAYDRKYNNFRYQPRYNRDEPKELVVQRETEDKGAKWVKLGDVKKQKLNPSDFIPTGIKDLDKKGLGLMRTHITVLSGHKASGKTSLMNMIVLNAVHKKYNVGMWSGEMSASEIKQWMFLQAAGKQFVKRRGDSEYYETSDAIDNKISTWIDNHFTLYSNSYSQDPNQISLEIEERFNVEKFDLVVLDNLMIFDTSCIDGSLNEKDKKILLILKSLAKKLNIHIILVAHPNKTSGLLRDKYISGSGDIGNIAQNIFLWHRVRFNENEYMRDFEKDYEDFFGKGKFEYVKEYSNLLEVSKFRAKGSLMGSTYGMFYEKESGRFLNSIAEHIVYGWEEQPVQQSLADSSFEPQPDYFSITPNPHFQETEVPF